MVDTIERKLDLVGDALARLADRHNEAVRELQKLADKRGPEAYIYRKLLKTLTGRA